MRRWIDSFVKICFFSIRMHIFVLFIIIILYCDCTVNNTDDCANVKAHIGSVRKRRHLTFPDNTNMVLTISLVKAFMTHAPSGWNIALEIDVMFPLPDTKFTNRFFRRKLHHRQKREFWERLQNAIELHNINGRACILRSICEARYRLAAPGKSLVHDLLRVVFTAPLHEEDFREEMNNYSELLDPSFCNEAHDCPFSLLDVVLAMNNNN